MEVPMKKLILGILAAVGSSSAFASPILTCKTTGAGGALIKQIILEKGAGGLMVKAESYAGEGLQEVKILKSISTPVSSKYVLKTNTGAKTSLVMYEKQAVMLYEAETASEFDENGASVEFLSCK
jgi:hypothetical protein